MAGNVPIESVHIEKHEIQRVYELPGPDHTVIIINKSNKVVICCCSTAANVSDFI